MPSRSTPYLAFAASALAILLMLGEAAWACPSCQEALAAHDPQSANLVKGYYYSILFMMGMPFTLLSVFSLSMYRAVKRSARERAENEPGAYSESRKVQELSLVGEST